MKKKIIFILLFFLILLIKPKTVKAFNTQAKSYILYNMNTNEIIKERNSNEKMLTASISKLLTAIIALETTNINKEVTITKEDLNMEGSKAYILEGEKVKLIDLIYGLLLRSGNDCANAISNACFGSEKNFVKKMNEYAKKLKMKNSFFNNPSGLDEKNSNYSTAYDMALLMTYCFKNETFKKINNTQIYKFKSDKTSYVFKNKHRLINKKSIYNGGKTGYTKKAGRTLVTTATKNNLNLVVVTFKDPNDFNDHEELIKYGIDYYEEKVLLKKQVLNYYFDNKNYLGYIKDDIIIYKDDNLNDYYILIYFYQNKIDDVIGIIKVYLHDNYLFSVNIYEYDPLSNDNKVFYDLFMRYFYD